MVLVVIYKIIRRINRTIMLLFYYVITLLKFLFNGVNFHSDFTSRGIPFIDVVLGGRMVIGRSFSMNNTKWFNPIGRSQKCSFYVAKNAELVISDHVGISGTAIVCSQKVFIGNYVKIGGGCCIYDTDFHSIIPEERKIKELDIKGARSKVVIIEDNVFIGAHTTILKGVVIGKNSIIGACSVVTKPVPANQIWAGNPARFIKNL